MKLKGIDVSHHNGVVDWDKVKAAGIQFAILRCGYGRKSINRSMLMIEIFPDISGLLGGY